MQKILFLLALILSSFAGISQKKIARYYVGGKLYATHTYYINKEHGEQSVINVFNTQNYKGSYTSCASCKYDNKYGVTIIPLQNTNLEDAATLMVRYVDKTSCILVFENYKHNADKTEVYLAKEVISSTVLSVKPQASLRT